MLFRSIELLYQVHIINKASILFLALFSGPYGISEFIDYYETIFIIASGFGIAAVIPYLKKMIYGYNTYIY